MYKTKITGLNVAAGHVVSFDTAGLEWLEVVDVEWYNHHTKIVTVRPVGTVGGASYRATIDRRTVLARRRGMSEVMLATA